MINNIFALLREKLWTSTTQHPVGLILVLAAMALLLLAALAGLFFN
ncbi:hypothetical protein [Desulfocurvus sp. DL9XJH121]